MFKTKDLRIEQLKNKEDELKERNIKEFPPNEKVMFQIEVMGYADVIYSEVNSAWCVVTEIDTKYSPKLTLYSLRKGEERQFKMDRKTFNTKDKTLRINKGDLIKITDFKRNINKFQMGMVGLNQRIRWSIGLLDTSNIPIRSF